MMYPVLETERVVLKPYEENNAETVFELVKVFDEQAEVPQFSKIKTIEDAKKLNEETVKNGNWWLIFHKGTNMPLGWVLCVGKQ